MTDPGQGGSDSAAPQPPPSGTFVPLVSIRAHKTLALVVMLVVMAAGAPVVLSKRQPVYMVNATVYVAPRFIKVLKTDQELEFGSNTQYLNYVQQQVRNITRYDILLEALSQLGPYRSLWQKPGETDRKAVLGLSRAITARAIKDTYLIGVTLEGGQAHGLAETLNTVLNTYMTISRRDDLYASDQRLEELRNRQTVLAREMEEKTRRRAELADLLGVATFEEGAQNNPYERLLQEAGTALFASQRRLIEAQAALDTYDETRRKEARASLDAAAAQIVANDSGLNSLKYHLWARRGELLNEISGLSPQHPLRAVAERKLRDLEDEVKTATATLLNNTRNQLLEQRRTAVRETREVEQGLTAEQQRLQDRAKWFIGNYNEGLELTLQIRRIRTQLDAVSERIDFLTLEAEAPGFLRLESSALPPEYAVGGGVKTLALLIIAVAVGLGLVVPVGLDLLDRRVKTATQVHRLLGFAPVAALLDERNEHNRLVWMDQMRRLMLALSQERSRHDTRRIAITAVRAGNGVTELIMNLAREFALDGLRVIAVEANAMKPDERYLPGPLAPGLLDLLNGEASLDQAIVPATDALPDRMPVGLALRRHLPFYDRFPRVLDPLLERYDIVLLDTPPVLLSADTEFLARYADAVLLLVSAGRDLPGAIKRATRLLEKADPRLFGVIVNRLQVYRGGGYYAEMVDQYEASEIAASELLQSGLDTGRAAREPGTATPSARKGKRSNGLRKLFRFGVKRRD
ncbi:MAG: chain length determinant protein [Candidatus Competibacteraceae bacterium]